MDDFAKIQAACELAWDITCSGDSEVTAEEVMAWQPEELYTWLRENGYVWEGGQWIQQATNLEPAAA